MRNKRIIWTSSYDRGLQHLLEMWPDIRKAVPDAELEVFYGWQIFDKMYANNPASMAWKAKIVSLLGQEGIVKHGKLSQEELAEEMRTCGIWAYPTHFQEISCISAMKAQAYGCIPVVIDEAALKETVQFGVKIEGDIYDEETKEAFKKQLIWVLQNPQWQEEIRPVMMEWANKTFQWNRVAKQWDDLFNKREVKPILEKPEKQFVKYGM